MIGAINKTYNNGDKKENVPLALSGSLHAELIQRAHDNNFSKSEIGEYALRRLFGMPVDNCKSSLINIFK